MKSDSGIIYCPYIPKQIVLTEEQLRERFVKEHANKVFAKVKLTNDNPKYRGKTSEVIMSRTNIFDGHIDYLLNIETLNSCSRSGMMTLMGPGPQCYHKIWFSEDEVELIHYDENANIIENGEKK